MEKKCKVIMLPTKDRTDIVKENITNKIKLSSLNNSLRWINQHLYITSDDEIKEGDWFIGDNISIKQCTLNNGGNINFKGGWYSGSTNCKKIIATTDESLTKEHDDTVPYPKMRETGVKLIPESFIKQYVEADGKIDEVEIEIEEYLDQTYSEHGYYKQEIKLDSDNCVIIHTIKDSWNREEVIDLFNKMYATDIVDANIKKLDFDKWIKENL